MQSVECKALKVALGLPLHASSSRTYFETQMLPLEEYRELACCKFVIKNSATKTHITSEIKVRSDIDFPKRAKSISSQVTLATFTSETIANSGISVDKVSVRPSFFPIPSWELQKADFDIDHTNIKKDDNINMLASYTKCHIEENYKNDLKIYTDGSCINSESGCAFLIPELKIEKSFYIGLNKSIFTAELTAILMALNYLISLPKIIFQVLFCVDSKSVLQALQGLQLHTRPEMIMEISCLVHMLIIRGTRITFCWIPSHCSFYYNEKVDRAAKHGARCNPQAERLHFPLSLHEHYGLIRSHIWKNFQKKMTIQNGEYNLDIQRIKNNCGVTKTLLSLMYRWKLDAFKTKYVKGISCICGSKISPSHILSCNSLDKFIPVLKQTNLDCVFNSPKLICDFFVSLEKSPIGHYL